VTDQADPAAGGFFDQLAAIADSQQVLKSADYRPAPADWALIATDIVGSTQLIEAGQHKTVNFVAAMAIAALKNQCAPASIPFLFGGDGSVIMVPANEIDAAKVNLARVRQKAQQEFGVALRVSLCTVQEIRNLGAEVMVARYEPSPGNSFGIFSGGGVEMLEAAMRGRGYPELQKVASIDPELGDDQAVDLSGLSCRWDELKSRHGKMVTIIVDGCANPADIYDEVFALAGRAQNLQPVRTDNLTISWPPIGFMLEARARRTTEPLFVTVIKLACETLMAHGIFRWNKPVGGFDPAQYRAEMANNTDFCKYDDTLCFVLDCPEKHLPTIRTYLERQASERDFRFGMHTSETALMTCLVTSPKTNLHVHFVDGGGGGYTEAAKSLKGVS
jgi:hypothetical protein